MLVLSRKPGERVVAPHLELAVTVLAVEGKAVRLGIAAPEDVAVYREEVTHQLLFGIGVRNVQGNAGQ